MLELVQNPNRFFINVLIVFGMILGPFWETVCSFGWYVGRLVVCWCVGLPFGGNFLIVVPCWCPSGVILVPFRSILGALGASWASFWEFGGLLGAPGGQSGPPWPPKGPNSEISHFFPSHFGSILPPFWSVKSVKNPSRFSIDFWMDFGWILAPFWEPFGSHFRLFVGTFRDMAKTQKIAPRVGESTKIEDLGGQKWCQNLSKIISKTG